MGSELDRRSGYSKETMGNLHRMDSNRREIEKFSVRRAGRSSLAMEFLGSETDRREVEMAE